MDAIVIRLRKLHIPAPVQGMLPALVCLVTGLADRLYFDIDNYYISIVTNGLYSPGGITVHLHPLLSFASVMLGRLLPSADGFALLTRIALVFAMWWLGTLLALCIKNLPQRLISYFVLILAMLHTDFFPLNFTIVAAIFGFVGLCTLLVCLRLPLGHGPTAAGITCLSLCGLWRYEVALLFLPFFVLDLVVLLLRHAVTKDVVVRILVPCTACIGMLCVSLIAFFSVSPYKEARAYSIARSTICDFPAASWSDADETLDTFGLGENDYRCLTGMVLVDSDVYTLPIMQAFAEVCETHNHVIFTLETLVSALRSNAEALWNSSLARFAFVVTIALTAVAFLVSPGILSMLEIVCAWGGGIFILVYYALRGRVRDRIVIAILLCLIALLLPNACRFSTDMQRRLKWLHRVGCAVLGATCLLAATKQPLQIYQLALNARADTASPPALAEYTEDAIYLWNPMALDLYMTEHYLERGKLPPSTFLEHNIPYGEWITGQPYFHEMLARTGLGNPMKALAERPHTYLIALRNEPIQTLLREHYDSALSLEQVATQDVFAMGDVPVYRTTHEKSGDS